MLASAAVCYVIALFCHANQFNGVHSLSCYWRTIWDKLTFMPTACLIWLFTHAIPFVSTDARKTKYKKNTNDSKIKEVTKWKTMKNSFENIPNDTQTQIFYILPLSPFACFSTNKWISFFFSRFSCEYWIFRNNCFMVLILSQPKHSIGVLAIKKIPIQLFFGT